MMDVQYWSNPSNRYKSIYLISYAFSGLLPTHMGPTPILALISGNISAFPECPSVLPLSFLSYQVRWTAILKVKVLYLS